MLSSKGGIALNENPKVFISYSHQDADYEKKVLEFSNKLRSEGIDASVDLYEESPSGGWPRWMENQIRESDYVLVLCSKSYHDKFYSDKKGKGITWEVNIIYQYLYDECVETKKFIPVFFENGEEQYIPTPIKGFTYYNIGNAKGYEDLYWRLRGVQKTQKPPLGKLRPLPEKERKTMFFSTPIDLEKWNNACWKGMLYLFQPGYVPVLGLLFENYDVAKQIFSVWKTDAKDNSADEFLKVSYVVSPFPDNCWVYSDPERSYGKGYFVHIGPNVDKSIERAIESGISPDEILLASVSRYQWMDEINGSANRDMFKKITDNDIPYLLMPIGIKNKNKPIVEENLIIDFEYSIKMNKVSFYKGTEVKDDNMCKAVLQKAENL